MPDPQAGVPNMGFITLTSMGEPLEYNCFPVYGSSTWWKWDLTQVLLLFSSRGIFVFGCKISFLGRFQCLLSMGVYQLVVILVFS